MRLLASEGVALDGVARPQVEDEDARVQRRHRHFVHHDVLAVELDAADAVAHVRLPVDAHGAQVEHLLADKDEHEKVNGLSGRPSPCS